MKQKSKQLRTIYHRNGTVSYACGAGYKEGFPADVALRDLQQSEGLDLDEARLKRMIAKAGAK